MKNTFKKAVAATAAIALGFGIAGLSATAANAATDYYTPEGSTEAYYLYSLDTGVVIPAGTKLAYTSGVVAAPSATDPDQLFAEAPEGADDTRVFIAPRGEEGNKANWNSSFSIGFKPGTRQVLQPTASLEQFNATSFAPVKAAGGDYSIGIAYTKNNGVTLVGVGSFTHIHLDAGTADWTFVTPGTPVAPGQPAAGSPGEIGLEATVGAAVDGDFSLSIPTGAKATLGTPTMVEGKSTSTGVLPTFSVVDERRVTAKGWDATASVQAFTRSGGTESIAPEALRVAPKTVVAGTTSTGVSSASAFQASASGLPFASAPAGAGLGVTNLSADLTFAAPSGSVQGTYTSKVTVTVVSK